MELTNKVHSIVVDLLPVLGFDRHAFSRYLAQKVENNDKSSTAVLNSILALASYYRGESKVQVEQFKQIALEQMYTDIHMTACEAGGHVAANMLLCVLEMQQAEEGDSSWVGYVCSFKEVLHVFAVYEPCPGDDSGTLLAAAYYFDTIARFGIRHWRTKHVQTFAQSLGFDRHGHKGCYLQYLLAHKSLLIDLPGVANCAHVVMRLLAEVFATLMYSSDPRYKSSEYQDYLDGLRSRLSNASMTARPGQEVDQLDKSESLLELACLAGMIYLERVSRNFSGQSLEMRTWTERALLIIARLDSYANPFSMFIIGCESSSDRDRTVILDFYAGLQKRSYLPHLLQIKSLIETAWNQHDLQVDAELEYIAKLNLVMSTRDIVPCFI